MWGIHPSGEPLVSISLFLLNDQKPFDWTFLQGICCENSAADIRRKSCRGKSVSMATEEKKHLKSGANSMIFNNMIFNNVIFNNMVWYDNSMIFNYMMHYSRKLRDPLYEEQNIARIANAVQVTLWLSVNHLNRCLKSVSKGSQKSLKWLSKVSKKSLKSLSKVSQKYLKSLSKVSQKSLKSHSKVSQKSLKSLSKVFQKSLKSIRG